MKWFSHILDALLPEECVVCEQPLVDGEKFLCLHCRMDIPELHVTDIYDNEVHETLASTHPVEKAVAWFRYRRESPYTRLIHYAKYDERPNLARWVGNRLGGMLEKNGFLNDVDALVPVPLNGWKMMRRGYNQSMEICKGINEVVPCKIEDALKAKRHSTQTRKGAAGRRSNARGVYHLSKPQQLARLEHIALVDDVITTGSTVLACADEIRSVFPSMRISVIAGALTEL